MPYSFHAQIAPAFGADDYFYQSLVHALRVKSGYDDISTTMKKNSEREQYLPGNDILTSGIPET
jgi:hypothetical protein